jgi:hypothetical protein
MMRRSALRRGKPLRAKRWGIAPKKPRRLFSERNDSPYRRFVCTLRCMVPATVAGATQCRGETQPSHTTINLRMRGMALKAPDRLAVVPHCAAHHREWDQHRGVFAGWSKEQRMEQAAAWVDAVLLLATPEDRDSALAFQEMGLGRIVDGEGGAFAWVPGPARAGGAA